MDRRDLLKGAAVTATVSALGVETYLAKDGQVLIVEDKPVRYPGLYVEISARQSGKTQRLVDAVRRHCLLNPYNLAIVISPWMTEDHVRARIHGINDSRRETYTCSAPPPGDRQIMAVPNEQAHLAMIAAGRRLSDLKESLIGNRQAQEEGVIRWFFDDWDQMEVPAHFPGFRLPFMEAGYYSTTLKKLRAGGDLEEPHFRRSLFRDLMQAADRVVSYRRGRYLTDLDKLFTEEQLRLDNGGIFDPSDRPEGKDLPLVELYRLGCISGPFETERKGLFPVSIC